jgi:glycosyltransferase involved in cell wall biosynthesis
MLDQGGIAHLLRHQKLSGVSHAIGLLRRIRRAFRETPADVVHINWLQNALALWGTSTPALITVLGSDFRLLALPGMRLALRHVLKQRRAILAPNAEWMAPELNRTFGDIADIRPVPFGVEAGWFNVQRRPPDNAKKWLVVSRLTRAKLGNLFEWGENLFNGENELHLFGPMQEEVALPPWIIYHGSTHPTELRETWFPQAAGLITLSRHDEGRPQVMLEAMAAGLPVIASNLSAHRDIIQHRQTGWLVDSVAEFREALEFLEIPGHNQEAGSAAHAWTKANIGTWDDCAERYAAAYRQLLERFV